MCWETFLELLSLQEPPSHTKRTEGRSEQHYRGAAVRNTRNGCRKKRPPGKTVARNRDVPT
jgi:hypothetical protein